jgi:hypothetical protein
MNYQEWLNLLGRDSEDTDVKVVLQKRGIKSVPPIKKDELDTRVQLDDAMLIFSTAELFPSRSSGGDGVSVLSGIILPLKGYEWGEYKGELPLKLQRTDSQKILRQRFGEPLQNNERFRWDEWEIDGLLTRVTYAKGDGLLSAISLKLPKEA